MAKKIIFALWTTIIIISIEVIIIGAWWNNRSSLLMILGIIAGVLAIILSVFSFRSIKKI